MRNLCVIGLLVCIISAAVNDTRFPSQRKWFTPDSTSAEVMLIQLSQIQDYIDQQDYPNALEAAKWIIITSQSSVHLNAKILFRFIEKTTTFNDTKNKDILEIRWILIDKFVKMINLHD